MITRLDRTLIDVPKPKELCPDPAAAVQELPGGTFGEMSTKSPTARRMVGYLLVRGGVHIVAYAKAVEKLTGVDLGKMLPIPDVSNEQFPEAREHEEKGLHRIRFSPNDYREITQIWGGTHPEDGKPPEVKDGPPEGAPVPDLDEEPQLTAPGVAPDLFAAIAKRMGK